ncbi:MAG TPA: alpha/beta hydrolase [Steroidobacteraceae bacterium]|nr:alpha/beta hydrolase [Steroidobacteraceae bacterium]
MEIAGWLLFTCAVLTAFGAVAALVPGRHLGWGNVVWFFAAWPASELAPFAMLASAGLAALLASWGAFATLPGRLGLALLVIAWCALVVVQWRTRRARPVLEQALAATLGSDYGSIIAANRRAIGAEAVRVPEILRPFALRRPGVEWHRDIRYADDHPRQLLDVYTPDDAVLGAPVLLQIHGGGWTFGDKRDQALPLVYYLAARGWIVVTPNYRLAPAVRFPAQLIDCKRALAWIRRSVHEFGGDRDFVAVTGGSAGGHLAALVALTANRSELQPGFEDVRTDVSACVPLYGVYDFPDRSGLRRDGGAMTDWLARKVMPCRPADDPALWALASPVAEVHGGAPPFFVLHGTHDSLAKVEEAQHFVRCLREISRQPVAYAELPGAQHAWDLFRTPRALETVHAVARFLEWARAADAAVTRAA